MANAISFYNHHFISWGAKQTNTSATLEYLNLPATQMAPLPVTWDQVDANQQVRQGGIAAEAPSSGSGAPGTVMHYFAIRIRAPYLSNYNALGFRIQDTTNSLTLANINAATINAATGSQVGTVYVLSTTFANLPVANATLELQYFLAAGYAWCYFYAGVYSMTRWP